MMCLTGKARARAASRWGGQPWCCADAPCRMHLHLHLHFCSWIITASLAVGLGLFGYETLVSAREQGGRGGPLLLPLRWCAGAVCA